MNETTLRSKIATAASGFFPRVSVEAEEDRVWRSNRTGMLLALGNTGKHVYAGTVSGAEKARRRTEGKAQRRARRASRR